MMGDKHYRSLVIAGLGTVGQGLLTLANKWFASFDQVVGVDQDESLCRNTKRDRISFQPADICDETFLERLCQTMPNPIMLVNLCSGIDTVKLRRMIQDKSVGYIDICESEMPENDQSRFSIGMPYTNQACHGDYPHWLCQGINPGLVEYMARKLMRDMTPAKTGFSITIFENDQLTALDRNGKLTVGWCPRDLIEEVMVCPSLACENGNMVEGVKAGTHEIMTCWQGVATPARLVGHEDVWSLGQLDEVSDVKFLYALCPDVMAVFKNTLQTATEKLQLPDAAQTLHGSERIVVSVEHNQNGQQKSLLWQTDHAMTQRFFGLNSVQYQTASSVLLSILMMQHTSLGRMAGTWNASTLPLADADWQAMESFMDTLGIAWQPVTAEYVVCRDPVAVGPSMEVINAF